uniref:Uncharacterized protein n=1 Tax=Tanacetum cinerariifolium TaxID=118510 RepID=A0A699JUD4_TANCI|nr:hypothetical protein [Tanacetum cinerariifolium]
MTTLADKAILSSADNRLPMLEKEMYDSGKSIMELYMMNRQHGRMILESVENGPVIWPSIEENRVTRPNKYSELSATESIQADCDVKATNIILQGLPPEERECKLYDEFDKFGYKKGETLLYHNVYSPSSFIPKVEYAPSVNQQPKFSHTKSGLIVPVFQKGNDPIDAINHMMSFLTVVFTSRVTLQPIQGRQTSLAAGTSRTYTLGASIKILGNKGLLSVTTVKGKVTCPNSAQNQRGNRMIHGLRIKCYWYKLKQMVKFYMRRN